MHNLHSKQFNQNAISLLYEPKGIDLTDAGVPATISFSSQKSLRTSIDIIFVRFVSNTLSMGFVNYFHNIELGLASARSIPILTNAPISWPGLAYKIIRRIAHV